MEEEEHWKILLEKRGGKMRGFSEFKKFQNAITPFNNSLGTLVSKFSGKSRNKEASRV